MNGKALIPLVAGLGIGGFALWMGFNTLKNARGAQRPVEHAEIWSATTDIPRGTYITEEMIQPLRWPAGMMPPGAVQKKDELVGRVPRLDAPAGLPILNEMLLPPGARQGLIVKPGYRAVAVQIDAGSGVDYHLEPGCFVDVIGSFTIRNNQGRNETIARTILENVEVAAVGPRVSPVQTEEEGGRRSSRKVRAVTLLVKPDDPPKLLLTEQKGRIKLSLRNDEDGGRPQSNENTFVSMSELTGEQDDDAPTPAPRPTPTTIVRQPVAVAPAAKAEPWTMSVVRPDGKERVQFNEQGVVIENNDRSARSDDRWQLNSMPPAGMSMSPHALPAPGSDPVQPPAGGAPTAQAEQALTPDEMQILLDDAYVEFEQAQQELWAKMPGGSLARSMWQSAWTPDIQNMVRQGMSRFLQQSPETAQQLQAANDAGQDSEQTVPKEPQE